MNEKHDDAATDLLIKEVDEDLRQERLSTLWKKYGSLFAAAAVVLVLAVAGWQGWRAWDIKQRQAASQHYAEAAKLIDDGKRDEGAALLAKLSVEGPKGYRILAELRRAELRQQAGDLAGAGAIYQTVAADSAVDKVYRDLAVIKGAYLALDGGDPLQVEKSVEALAVESSAWRHSAREIQALTAARRGDSARVAEIYRKLAEDSAAPQGLRARAAEMLAAVGQRGKS